MSLLHIEILYKILSRWIESDKFHNTDKDECELKMKYQEFVYPDFFKMKEILMM